MEQFFDCFTDGLELKLDMFCPLAWPEMDMMWREGTLAFARLLVANEAADPRGSAVELANHRAVREYRRKISSQRKGLFLTIFGCK